MRKKIISAMLALCMAGSLLTGCGTSADAGKKSEDSGDVTTVKWFTSRPVDGAIDQVMHEIADEYSEKMGGKWKIEFETTADRPSYGLSVPKTMDEWLDVCKTLKENGVTPISVDGVDRWPVQRYLAMMPFRESGNDYIINLRDGKEKMAGDEGKEAATFMKNIGQYFNDGFAATDYATAQSMFLDGKSAMYYIGDWEIAAMQDAYKAGKIDYFYLPTIENGKTDASEFCVNSGIGMAFNAKTFDAKTKDFILYVLDNYGEKYAAKQQMSPIKTELPSDVEFSDLYLRIRDDMDKTGAQFLKPWDTYLDADTNTTMQDNLLLLASGDMSVDDFCKLIDDSIATNAKN